MIAIVISPMSFVDQKAPVFAALNQYDATTHFVGQSTIFTLTGERGTGEAYCLPHHVTFDGSKRRLMTASLRYLVTFVKSDGAYHISNQLLHAPSVPEPPPSRPPPSTRRA